MELLDQALIRLFKAGEISRETVFEFCNDREDVAKITGERETSNNNGKDANLSTQFN
jgi:hypothetical protein